MTDIKQWLYSKLETQIRYAQESIQLYVDSIKNHDKGDADIYREQLSYWLDRIENTQRCITEYEQEQL